MKEKKAYLPFLYVGFVVVAALVLVIGHKNTTNGEQIFGKFAGAPIERAKVVEILYDDFKIAGQGIEKHRFFRAEVQGGTQDGTILKVRQITDSFATIPIKDVAQGDNIIICYTSYGVEQIWVFQQYNRIPPLFVLLLCFFAVLLLFGGKKGIATIGTLVLTCTCVFYYFIPAILSGQNIYSTTIATCLYIITVTLVLINGFNFKSLSAAVGCLGGLVIAGILFFVMNHFLRLTGLIDEESAYLTMMGIPFDLTAMIFSSVVIGVLGGVLDVGVSIASSLNEIYPKGTKHPMKQVMQSGMNIGKDILCTTTNTLILVYIGSALSLTLLLTVYSNSWYELVNRETVTVEILSALLGSIGLLSTIPLTSFFYALGTSYSHTEPLTLPEPTPIEVRSIYHNTEQAKPSIDPIAKNPQ